MTIPPSGRQFELRHGDQVLTAVEVGGGLRTYQAGNWALLDGYELDEMCPSARGQLLVPWPNRIGHGSYAFRGRQLQLPLTEPPKQNAIHGLARWAAWRPLEQAETRLVLAHVIPAQPGYPFTVEVQVEYRLDSGGLTVVTTATNLGGDPCPYGSGAHPYLRVGEGLIDEAILRFSAQTWYETDERQIPTGTAAVAGSPFDFSRPRSLGETVIDTAFTGLERDADGRARVVLSSPDGAREVAVWLDENHPYVMVFTGDTLPEEGRRRRGLGLEPMTCAPNAFASGDGLRVLEPGASFSAAWGLEVSQQA